MAATAPRRLPMDPESAPPRPPKGLSPASRRFWRSVVNQWEMQSHNLMLMEQACRTLDVIADAEAAIARDGEYVEGRFGPKAHPASVVRDRNRVLIARLVRELGLALEEPPTARPPSRWHGR